jgi:hypothetical protein
MEQGPRYLKPGWLTSRVLNPLLTRLGINANPGGAGSDGVVDVMPFSAVLVPQGGGHYPMGDAKAGPFCLSFNPRLRVECRGSAVAEDLVMGTAAVRLHANRGERSELADMG